MASEQTTIGWMIDCEGMDNLGFAGNEHGLAITLIRPFATGEILDKTTIDFSAISYEEKHAITGKDIEAHYESLMRPWVWEEGVEKLVGWRLFYWKGGKWHTVIDVDLPSRSGVDPICIQERAQVRKAISAELAKKSEKSMFALSPLPDDADSSDAKGYAHVLAPMGQLVSPISNETLRLGHILSFDKKVMEALTAAGASDAPLVAFPVIWIGKDRHFPEPIDHLFDKSDVDEGLAIAEYKLLGKTRTEKTKIDVVKFVSQATKISSKKSSTDGPVDPATVKLEQQIAAAEEILGSRLGPVIMAHSLLNAEITTFSSEWPLLLMNTLGRGWLRDDPATVEIDHVYNGLASAEQLQSIFDGVDAFGTLRSTFFEPAAFANIPDDFLDDMRQPSNTPLQPTESFWLGLAYCYSTADVGETRESLLREWGGLASQLITPERAWEIHKCWLSYLAYKGRKDGFDAINYRMLLENISEFVTPQATGECLFASFEYALGGSPVDFMRQLFEKNDRTNLEKFLVDWMTELTIAKSTKDVQEAITAFVDGVQSSTVEKPVSRDDGLFLRMTDPAKKNPTEDMNVRGVAVGLLCRLGDEKKGVPISQAWITDTHVTVHVGADDAIVATAASGAPTVGSCTIGSAAANGRRMVEALFDGDPLCSARGIAKPLKAGAGIKHEEWVNSDDDFDNDETDAIDYSWYQNPDPDPDNAWAPNHVHLGFGLQYWAMSTEILNSGVVRDPAFRYSDSRTSLAYEATLKPIDAGELTGKWKPQSKYLSLESIGAPIIEDRTAKTPADEAFSWDDGLALASQTRSADYLAAKAAAAETGLANGEGQESDWENARENVALLIPPGDTTYLTGPKQYTLKLQPPVASPAFVERWLNTEVAIAEAGGSWRDSHSDPLFKKHDRGAIERLQRTVREIYEELGTSRDKELAKLPIRYHPSVSEIGIEVTWYGVTGFDIDKPVRTTLSVSPHKEDESGNLLPASKEDVTREVYVESRDTRPSQKARKDSLTNEKKVLLGPGEFVKVRTFSLTKFEWINDHAKTGALPRYHKNVVTWDKKSPNVPDGKSGTLFPNDMIGFGGPQLYFECAPSWLGLDAAEMLQDHHLDIRTPTAIRPNAARLMFDPTEEGIKAAYLVGARIERHEWHWTGTPIEFSTGDAANTAALKDWVVSMAGVGSYRDGKDIEFSDSLSEDLGAWTLTSNQELDTVSRADHASSSLLAYTLRPKARFSEWLNQTATAVEDIQEKTVVATGKLLQGGVPKERLSTPVARFAIPMTESFDRQTPDDRHELPKRGSNGVLLVFDEPIMRTDERSRYSGIGEVIEVDVVDVREYPPTANADDVFVKKEMGPNPIFHPAPKHSTAKERQRIEEYDVNTSRPFGLTYDVGSNPRVGQTAISVFPKGAGGEWFLAKIRTRKVILPETLLDYPVSQNTKDAKGNSKPFLIGTRLDGEDVVPVDFFVDCDDKSFPSSIKVDGKHVEVPKWDGEWTEGLYRIRTSWHKGRWGTAKSPHWRPVVEVQKRKALSMEWERLKIASAYVGMNQTFNWDAMQPENPDLAVTVDHDGSNGRVGRLNISDYSDSRWISFIGMFGSQNLGRADEYSIERGGDGNVVIHGPSVPTFTGTDDALSDDSVNPVFQVLNVYEPTETVLEGKPSDTGGRLIDSYVIKENDGTKKFVRMDNTPSEKQVSWQNAIGYILSYQLVTARADYSGKGAKTESNHEKTAIVTKAATFDGLERMIFPSFQPDLGLNQKESLVRPVPQVLGPITISDNLNVQDD